MRFRPFPALLLAATMAIAATPSAAQTIDGVLLAEDGETPLPGARVALLGIGSRVVAEAQSDAEGRFTVTAAGAGMFRLRVQPAGGEAILFAPVTLAAGERRSLEFQAHPPTAADSVVALPGVTATAETRERRLERNGFYRRRHTYPGRFLRHDEFMRLHGFRVIEKLQGLGIGMEPRGGDRFLLFRQQHTGGADSPVGRCYISVFIDGTPVSDVPISQLTNEMVAAVEFYTRDDVPPEFDPRLGDSTVRCGSLAIWTAPPDAVPPRP